MITFLTLTRQFFLHTAPIDIINSWRISKMYATQIVKNVNSEDFTMAALVMQVNGFQFQGKVYIALDEGSDYLSSLLHVFLWGAQKIHKIYNINAFFIHVGRL